MSRKAEFANNKKVVVALKNIDSVSKYLNVRMNKFCNTKAEAMRKIDDNISYELTKQLIGRGLVKAEEIRSGGRGRPAHNYVVTGKGRGLIALSKNWK